jgi:hypothetical protein
MNKKGFNCYVPVVYMAQKLNNFDEGKSISRAIGRGVIIGS